MDPNKLSPPKAIPPIQRVHSQTVRAMESDAASVMPPIGDIAAGAAVPPTKVGTFNLEDFLAAFNRRGSAGVKALYRARYGGGK